MNATSLTNSPEPHHPAPKSSWRMEVPRWCNWYLLWAALSAIIICAACIYAGSHHSANTAQIIEAVLLTASFLMSLAALVRTFTKDGSNVSQEK